MIKNDEKFFWWRHYLDDVINFCLTPFLYRKYRENTYYVIKWRHCLKSSVNFLKVLNSLKSSIGQNFRSFGSFFGKLWLISWFLIFVLKVMGNYGFLEKIRFFGYKLTKNVPIKVKFSQKWDNYILHHFPKIWKNLTWWRHGREKGKSPKF